MKTVVKKHVIPAKYVEAVDRGVQFLDLVLGRKVWLKRMDMSSFDIKDSNTCVAGNIFKDVFYNGASDGYDSFVGAIYDMGMGGDKAAENFGFSTNTVKGWQYLQDLWVMKIKKLKAAKK